MKLFNINESLGLIKKGALGCRVLWFGLLLFGTGLVQVQAQVSLVPNGTSSLYWPFGSNSQYIGDRSFLGVDHEVGTENWYKYCESGCTMTHLNGDYHAQDWWIAIDLKLDLENDYNPMDNPNPNIDISLTDGAAFYSPLSGYVLFSGESGNNYGNLIVIRSDIDPLFVFSIAHLGSIANDFYEDEHITEGTLLGSIGDTGDQPQPHAHVVLYKMNDNEINNHDWSTTPDDETYSADFKLNAGNPPTPGVVPITCLNPVITNAFSTNNSITVTWEQHPLVNYEVFIDDNDAENCSPQCQQSGRYTWSNLEEQTEHTVTVEYTCNEQIYSNETSPITTGNLSNCSFEPTLSLTPYASHITVNWQDVIGQKFVIQYKKDGQIDWENSDIITSEAMDIWAIISNLSPNTTYHVRVGKQCTTYAIADWGVSDWVNVETDQESDLPCNISLNTQIIGVTDVYEATQTADASTSISNSNICIISNEITLQQGFEAENGSIVCIYNGNYTEDCANNGRKEASSLAEDLVEVDEEPNSFGVYPNPHHGQFTLQFEKEAEEQGTLKVYDPLGRVFLLQENVCTDQPITLDVSGGVRGLYFVWFVTPSRTEIQRVIYK